MQFQILSAIDVIKLIATHLSLLHYPTTDLLRRPKSVEHLFHMARTINMVLNYSGTSPLVQITENNILFTTFCNLLVQITGVFLISWVYADHC